MLDYQVSFSSLHAMMKMILDNPASRETNYSTIKYISYGASPIPLDLLKEAIEVFQCGFIQLYGMTETTGSVTYLPPGEDMLQNQLFLSCHIIE